MSRYVVKLGGNALDSLRPSSPLLASLASDVRDLCATGGYVVVVHGGGPQITELLDASGIVTQFHDGLRVTDEQTMKYVAMALSHVNLHLVAALVHNGLACVGLSGADNGLLRAEPVGPPWGRIGLAPKVDIELIVNLWRDGLNADRESNRARCGGRTRELQRRRGRWCTRRGARCRAARALERC